MNRIRIGLLADTHLSGPDAQFRARAAACFAGIDLILHAGDLTDLGVLAAFAGKEVHAVHGNMCGPAACQALPRRKTIRAGRWTIGLIHRVGRSYDFEEQLLDEFPEADCIVYGHTHRPVCHRLGATLLINPGSFSGTGRYGAPGTYAILEAGEQLVGRLHEVDRA
ncbi:MAG: YfcE family phosphodiesterase [Desulfobacteraceae bacterium]|nr:YfcE family phosphodiesterase [Desulfobacteraceae bacterium]